MNRIAIAKFVIIPALAGLTVLGACGKGTIGLVQNSEAKSSSGWTMKISNASQPETVKVKARSIYGGTEPEKDQAPSANQKWVLLNTEVTPPAGGASLPVKQIQLVDGANNYPALAIAGAPDKGEPALLYFKDAAGLAQVNASGQLVWAIMPNDNTREIDIVFQKAGAEKVFFLFSAPSDAKNLTLQLSP